MLSRSTISYAVSPFSLFLREHKGKLPGVTQTARGAALGALYRNLPEADRLALLARAKATPAPRGWQKNKPRKRTATPYNMFVRDNMGKVKGTQSEKMSAVARLWREQRDGKTPK